MSVGYNDINSLGSVCAARLDDEWRAIKPYRVLFRHKRAVTTVAIASFRFTQIRETIKRGPILSASKHFSTKIPLLSCRGTSSLLSRPTRRVAPPFLVRKFEDSRAGVRHFNRAIECLILSLIWLTSGLQSRACKTRERIVSWWTGKVYCSTFRK